jgi:hypothetical protein
LNNQSKVDIVIKAINQVGATVDQVKRTLGAIEPVARRADAALDRVGRGIGKIQSLLMGVGMGIGFGLFNSLFYGARRLAGSLPGLIRRGSEWARTVSELAVASGLAAEKASLLAVAADYLDISQDQVAKGMEELRARGMSAQQAFDTVTSAMGLTRAELRLLEQDAVRSGRILDQSAVNAASRWEAAQRRMQGTIDGLGSRILSGASPALESLINGIANTIQANLDNIVRFAVQAVNFVAGLIGGFLGLNFSLATFTQQVSATEAERNSLTDWLGDLGGSKAKKAKSGIDATTSALEKQIRAIDRQIEALDRQERKRDAVRERQDLITEIEEARRQLEDLRTKGVFTAGMSHAEAELARQKHAADIIDGEKNVAKAKDKLAEHDRRQATEARRNELQDQRRHLQDMLAAHRKHLQQVRDDMGKWKPPPLKVPKPDFGNVQSGLSQALRDAARDALRGGQGFADQIKTFLFGPENKSKAPWTYKPVAPGSLTSVVGRGEGPRSGGLLDAIAGFAKGAVGMAGAVVDLVVFLKTSLVDKIVEAFRSVFPEGSSRPLGPGTPTVDEIANGGLAYLIARKLPVLGGLIQGLEKGVTKGGGGVVKWGLPKALTTAATTATTGTAAAVSTGAGMGLRALLGPLWAATMVGSDSNPALHGPGGQRGQLYQRQRELKAQRAPDLLGGIFNPQGEARRRAAVEAELSALEAVTNALDRQEREQAANARRQGAINPTGWIGEALGQSNPDGVIGQLRKSLTNVDRNLGPGGATFRQLYDQTGFGSRAADSGETTADKVTSGIDATVTKKPGLPWDIEHPAFGPMRTSMDGVATNTGPLAKGRLGIDGNTSTGTIGVAGSQLGSIIANTDKLRNGRIGIDGSESTGNIGVSGSQLAAIASNTDALSNGRLDLQGTSLIRLSQIGDNTSNASSKLSSLISWQSTLSSALSTIAGRLAYGDGTAAFHLWKLRQGFKSLYPTRPFATGGAGYTNGPMNALFGEAGREAYAILRNPRPLPGGGYAAGGGGGGRGACPHPHDQTIHVPVALDGRQIAEVVTKHQVRGQMLVSSSSSGRSL